MLDYFSSFNVAMRAQRSLLRSLARWQSSPGGELGQFGLSVTAEVTNPRSCGSITVQFSLHHYSGGRLDSGAFTIDATSVDDLDWLSDATTPLLQEFLLPAALLPNDGARDIAGQPRAPINEGAAA